jgi:hypothetical protein
VEEYTRPKICYIISCMDVEHCSLVWVLTACSFNSHRKLRCYVNHKLHTHFAILAVRGRSPVRFHKGSMGFSLI